ncbi:MAG: cold shock domain-containing protein [Anaerolineae bacterium]|nr:cold shock domain-containing protein [Anaerolineae bacterium]
MSYRDVWVECEECGKKFVFTVEEQRQIAKTGQEVAQPTLCHHCLQAESGPGPFEGTVKWYDSEKGYGFIVQRSGNEIFFHRSGIISDGPVNLPDGTAVTYLVEDSPKGPRAVDVASME